VSSHNVLKLLRENLSNIKVNRLREV
jgi:hypothetical protein